VVHGVKDSRKVEETIRTLWISDLETGLRVEKSGGVVEGEGECGDDVVWLLSREARSLDILSVKRSKQRSKVVTK